MSLPDILLQDTFVEFVNSHNAIIDRLGLDGVPKNIDVATQPAGDNDTSAASTEFVQRRHSGVLTKNITGFATVNLTADECGYGVIILTGTMTQDCTIIVPSSANSWTIFNRATGVFSTVVKTASGIGTDISSSTKLVVCDGTDVFSVTGISDIAVGDVFFENSNIVTQSHTIPPGKNAMTAGPITVANGVEVTVPSGSVWTIV